QDGGSMRRQLDHVPEVSMNTAMQWIIGGMMLFAMSGPAGAAQGTGMGGDTDSGSYSVVPSDGGRLFGAGCLVEARSCYWSFTIQSPCDEGTRRRVVLSSDVGAQVEDIVCGTRTPAERTTSYFVDLDRIDRLVRSSKSLTIVYPLTSGHLEIMR